MPGRAARRRPFPSLTLLVCAAVAAAAAPASAAPLAIQHSIATPITAASPCTAEPKNPIYSNLGFTPSARTTWFDFSNLPSTDDVVAETRAGVNADFCIGYGLQPDFNVSTRQSYTVQPSDPKDPSTRSALGDDQKDITITLPAGVTANLKNVGTCTNAEFGIDGASGTGPAALNAACPENSLVGDAVGRISVNFLGQHVLVGGSDNTVPATDYPGAIWKLESTPNELGRLGVQLEPSGLGGVKPSKFVVRLLLAPDGSGRVVAAVRSAPRATYLSGIKDIYVEAIWMRMFGAAADHPEELYKDAYDTDMRRSALAGDFMETPTQCDAPVAANISLTTYGGTRVADPATYTPATSNVTSPSRGFTGCEQLPFSPTVSVSTTETTPGTPTGAQVRLHLGQDRVNGRLPALLKNAAVTLPGLELGAQVASDEDGLTFCTAEQFAASSALTASTCPAATEAGTVRITSPLIATPLVGHVYLGTPGGGRTLPDLYLEAALEGATADDAPRIKLVGRTTINDDGQVTATFVDAPPLRFDDLTITFPGGPHALFSTPQRCGTTTGRSLITSTARPEPVPVDASLTLSGCGDTFAPTASVEPLSPQAGRKGAARITIARPSSAPWLQRIAMHLPPGFLADLGSAAECGAQAAATGDCPASSRIGTLKVLAGAGDRPLPLTGAMYLSERRDGDVAGAVLVTRAKVGELDLGDVVVPGRIALRPTDAGLDFTADVPVRHKGVALQLQQIEVTLDRDQFALNPSACGPLGYTVDITGDGGQTASPSGSVSYSGCGDLPFRPSLRATLTGDNRPGGFPGMYVRLDSPEGDVGMRSASVTLPQGVAAALPNVRNPCPREDFDAVRCPAASRVGSVVARVSITPDAIRGDIFLIRVPGKTLPGLGLSFTGRYAQRVTSIVEVNKDGRLVTSFPAIPDLPLRSLEIQVDSGPRSPLQLPEGACAGGSNWDGVFTGQGGQTASAKTGLQCAASANARLSDKRGLTVRLFDFGGRKLQSLKATLPAGWRFDTRAAKKKGALWVRMTGATPSVRLTSRSLTVQSRSRTATDVRVKIGGKLVRPTTRAARKAKRVSIPLRLAFTDGTVQTQTLTVATR